MIDPEHAAYDLLHPHLEIRCPHCGRVNEHHDGKPGAQPSAGDFAMCWKCGGLAVFTVVLGRLGQRLPTADELAEAATNLEVQRAQAARATTSRPTEAIELMWGKQ